MFTKEERLFIWEKVYEINALPRSQDRANIMFNYHLTHKWDQYYH